MKKLWDTTAFTSGERSGHQNKGAEVVSNYFLTILLAIFLLIVAGILCLVLWTSNGGSDQKQAEQAFYNPSQSSTSTTSSSVTTETSSSTPAEETSSSSEESTGATLTVQAGEGAGSIAARAGISIEQLYELNPDKMVGPDGTWWANPGDIVKIK